MVPLLFNRILAQAAANPDKLAVKDARAALTYGQLVDRAVAAAAAMHAKGAVGGDIVGVWLENSIEYVVAILACLAADLVFLPLAVSDPEDRLQKKIAFSKMAVCVTSDHQILDAAPQNARAILSTSELMSAPTVAPTSVVEARATRTGKEIAYCVYTSGSTGVPKGVMVRGESISNLAESTITTFGFSGSTRALCVLPFHFDGSFESLFPVLSAGGALFVTPGEPMLPRELMDIMIKEAITHISFTPSILSLLVDSLDLNRLVESKLRTVGLGGENPSEADIARLKVASPNVRVFNRYGPTEAAVAVSSREVTDDLLATHEKIPLGLPGPGVSFHLVDVGDKIVNANLAPGELCIGGVQVMAGYLGDPETTASVLRSDLVPGELVYRTGDLVQRNAQGEYVYLDRLDNIVKRNGVRISLAEITAALRQIAGVSDAACIADARSGRTIITAYVSGDGLVGSKVRSQLLLRSPFCMIPDHLVLLESLPRSHSGKLDRNQLTTPEIVTRRDDCDSSASPFQTALGKVPPLTETERRLAEIWKKVLKLDVIDPSADFFDLGGDSLLALRVLGIVEKEFCRRMSLTTLLDSPTVKSFALRVECGKERQLDFRQVTRLYPDSVRPSIFGINSTGGYHLLGKLLGPELPLTALQLFDASCPGDRFPESMEQIAADYVRLIRRLQPRGPYNLLGWCGGGILTFEVAQQLVAANEEVSFLALIETYELLHHKRLHQKRFIWLRRARANLSRRLHWNLAEWAKVVAGQKSLAKFIMERRSMSRVSDFVTRPFRNFTEQAQELRAADFDYLASAAKKYKVKTFPGRIHAFRGASSERRGFVDDLMDWPDLAASGVEQIFIEGDHDSIFQPPGVRQMARKIFSAVAKANSIMGRHGAREEHEDTGTLQLGSEPKLLMRP